MVKILSFFLISLLLLCCEIKFLKRDPHSFLKSALSSYSLDREKVLKSLLYFTELPHPFGSSRQLDVRDHILSHLKELNIKHEVQPFKSRVPNRSVGMMVSPLTKSKQGYNISARLNLVENPTCIIGLGSHYDTKDIEGISYVGANDSASSSVLLLDLARFLLKSKKDLKLECDIQLIWFDGEESILPNWSDGLKHPAHLVDNTYGSRKFAEDLLICNPEKAQVPFLALIVLDMLAYRDLKISLDTNSHKHLRDLLVEAASFLGNKDLVSTRSEAIEDDHIPFQARDIAVLDIIDFNHSDIWHTSRDTMESVSLDSLQTSAKLALYVSLNAASNPGPLIRTESKCLQSSKLFLNKDSYDTHNFQPEGWSW